MNKDVLISLGWAAAIILLSLAAAWARGQGYIDEDTALRVVALNGLVGAYYGNLAPKTFVPNVHVRQANRFAGWALVFGGLAYAGFWAFAPIPMAATIGTGSLAAAVAATVVYCLWLRSRARRNRDTRTS